MATWTESSLNSWKHQSSFECASHHTHTRWDKHCPTILMHVALRLNVTTSMGCHEWVFKRSKHGHNPPPPTPTQSCLHPSCLSWLSSPQSVLSEPWNALKRRPAVTSRHPSPRSSPHYPSPHHTQSHTHTHTLTLFKPQACLCTNKAFHLSNGANAAT